MEIVTGKVGTPHVSSADARALNAAIIGTGNYVLNVGSKFNATIETSNNITIDNGELVINGTHARIPHGEHDTVIIENGETGFNRIDLIVARYTKTSDIEKVELVVINEHKPTTGTPTRPAHTQGNVLAGSETVDMPLYAVQLAGVNIASITPLFTIATGLDDVYRKNEVYTKGEVNSIKQNLQTNIDKAQSTANTGVANAAKAQETANTAVSNAATAQSAANTAQSTANTAINSLTTQDNVNNAAIKEALKVFSSGFYYVQRALGYVNNNETIPSDVINEIGSAATKSSTEINKLVDII